MTTQTEERTLTPEEVLTVMKPHFPNMTLDLFQLKKAYAIDNIYTIRLKLFSHLAYWSTIGGSKDYINIHMFNDGILDITIWKY